MKGLALRSSNQAYLSLLRGLVKSEVNNGHHVIDLFAGCGGLSLGFEVAGFNTTGYEMDETYADSYNQNLSGECKVSFLDLETKYPQADIVIGGPPCQPWSETGKNLGEYDDRDGFPAFIRCVERVKPRIFVAENVKGLSFKKNRHYLEHIISELENIGYIVDSGIIRMSDYGVPQKRERLFIVGHQGGFIFPEPSNHTFTVRDALGRAAISHLPKQGRYLTHSENKYIESYEEKCKLRTPRDLHLDQPARTLTCRNLAGSTADMIRLAMPDGRRRKLRISEAARLQAFPDWFKFSGSRSKSFYQIGQSVPPLFSYQLALSVKKYLEEDSVPKLKLIVES